MATTEFPDTFNYPDKKILDYLVKTKRIDTVVVDQVLRGETKLEIHRDPTNQGNVIVLRHADNINSFGISDNEYSFCAETGQYEKLGKQLPRAYWNQEKSKPYEKNMANKFLPFIVESSTPIHTFKTLLSRSKGVNDVTVASIFNMVLAYGIKKTRDVAKELPEAPLSTIYEELLLKLPAYRLHDEHLQLFHDVSNYFFPTPTDTEDWWSEELNQFETKEIMTFFLAMLMAGKDITEYTNISFHKLAKHTVKDTVTSDISKFVKFADNGQVIHFNRKEELLAFILYHALLRKEMEPDAALYTYCAVWSTEEKNYS